MNNPSNGNTAGDNSTASMRNNLSQLNEAWRTAGTNARQKYAGRQQTAEDLPLGNYTFRIERAEIEPMRRDPKMFQLLWILRVTEGAHAGRIKYRSVPLVASYLPYLAEDLVKLGIDVERLGLSEIDLWLPTLVGISFVGEYATATEKQPLPGNKPKTYRRIYVKRACPVEAAAETDETEFYEDLSYLPDDFDSSDAEELILEEQGA